MTPQAPDGRPPRRRRPPPSVDRGPRPLADWLDDALDGLAPRTDRNGQPTGSSRSSASTLAIVFSRWGDIVGSRLARHVQPIELSPAALTVGVDQPAWATQVRALGGKILDRVGEIAGQRPERLEVRVRPPGRR